MGGQELDSGFLVHFSAASAHNMTICPRAQKSAGNEFIHKEEKEKEAQKGRERRVADLSSEDSPPHPSVHTTCLGPGVLSGEPLFAREERDGPHRGEG